MPEYRLYVVKNGHISEPPKVIECGDDSEVIEHARQLLDGATIEVWELARRVARLEPD